MSLLQRWGFGAELIFDGARAIVQMGAAQRGVESLSASFSKMASGASSITSGITTLAGALAPLGIGFGFAASRASGLASSLEQQKLTMRVLLGSVEKAEDLMKRINVEAAKTPFSEGDLIEGSKRLLRLTGTNVDANMELLKIIETMTALNPTKNILDAAEAVLDATSGGGFERMKEFGMPLRVAELENAGVTGSKQFADAVVKDIRKRLQASVRGEDLVGALGETFGGRMSTFFDTIDNALKPIGARINALLGPALIQGGALVSELAPSLVAGVGLALDDLEAVWRSVGQPVFDALLGAWRGLDDGARAGIVEALTLLTGPLLAGFVAFGGALAALTLAAGAFGSIAGGAFEIAAGALGILAAPEALALLGLLVVGVGAVTAAMGGLFGVLAGAAGSEGFADIADAARYFLDGLMVLASYAGIFASQFATTFLYLFSDFGEELQRTVGPSLLRVTDLIRGLARQATDSGVTVDEVRVVAAGLARVLVGALRTALSVVAAGLKLTFDLMMLLAPVWEASVLGVRRLSEALFGVAGGTLSATEGIRLMAITIEQVLIGMIAGVSDALFEYVGFWLTALRDQMARLPGMSLLVGVLDSAREGLSAARATTAATAADKIASLDVEARTLEQRRAEAAAPVVNVEGATVNVPPAPPVSVQIDGKEIARSQGKEAVRAGERGTGPSLPAAQRGRVLRRGLEVTPLGVAEVMPGS